MQIHNRIVPLNSLNAVYREVDIINDSVAVTRKGTTLSSDQLRHTFATHALNAGIPINVVSKWIGHAKVSVTYNTYIHMLESAEAAALALLEAIREN